jgi:uncharacterized membrane protein
VLSVVVALLVSVGAMFGGSLVYDYGFNVGPPATTWCGISPKPDVFPGQYD